MMNNLAQDMSYFTKNIPLSQLHLVHRYIPISVLPLRMTCYAVLVGAPISGRFP
jgi:hypothetical protein